MRFLKRLTPFHKSFLHRSTLVVFLMGAWVAPTEMAWGRRPAADAVSTRVSAPDLTPDAVPAPPVTPTPSSVAGLYALGEPDTPIHPTYFEHADLAGVSLRLSWKALEPQEGVLDTGLLDVEIARAKAADKKVRLRVLPGTTTPDWVYAKGVASLRWVDPAGVAGGAAGTVSRVPVPWDPEYLAAWTSFIARLGAHVGGEADIVLVHVTGGHSISSTFDRASGAPPLDTPVTYLDDRGAVTARGTLADLFTHAAGYSLGRLRASWAASSDAWAAAFPTAHLAYSVVNDPSLQGDAMDVVNRIVADAAARYPARLALQNDGWNDAGSIEKNPASHAYPILRAYAGTTVTGFQSGVPHGTCSGAGASGDLGPFLAVGIYHYGADYFELDPMEIDQYPDLVQECNDFLLGKGQTCGMAGVLLCAMDLLPPTVSITSPTEGDTVSGEITVTVIARDDTLVFDVALAMDGVPIGPARSVTYPASATFHFAFNTAMWPDGPHTLSVIARDVSGNAATLPIHITLQQ